MKEIWKDIEEYEGLYQVSNLGRVKALEKTWITGNHNSRRYKPETMLTIFDKNKGYHEVYLSKNTKVKMKRVARLVAGVFIPNPDNLPEVNHKDGNKANNVVSNLEWCTRKQNIQHAWDNSLFKKEKISGENNYKSKLKNIEVDEIRQKYSTGNYTYRQLAKEYGVYYTTIHKLIKKQTYGI